MIAVDYLNNVEKFGKFVVTGMEHNVSTRMPGSYTNSFENTYRESLKYGTNELDVFRQNSKGETMATLSANSYSSFAQHSETDFTWLSDLGYLDVRHSIINYGYASYPDLTHEATLLDPGAPGTPPTTTVTTEGKAAVGMNLHLGLDGEPESLFSFQEPLGETYVGSPFFGSVGPCSSDSDHTVLEQGPRYSTNMGVERAGFNDFSIGVDRQGGRFASQRYREYSVGNILSLESLNSLDPNPQFFNWLTNGAPRSVIPTGGEVATYYPIGVR
ncbi:MAG: hypothetical protein OEQ39_16725 [Gammaproteobacteria bacterium]|nr:hypothetical protein [Gammaproteobacteria bacterium]MDH3467348.1 hypothetical protein [Gammaproteobacteria bacterium]